MLECWSIRFARLSWADSCCYWSYVETFFTECQDTFDFLFISRSWWALLRGTRGTFFWAFVSLVPPEMMSRGGLSYNRIHSFHILHQCRLGFLPAPLTLFILLFLLYLCLCSCVSAQFAPMRECRIKSPLLLLLLYSAVLLPDTDLFKIGGKGQWESHFLTTQMKINFQRK